MEYWEALESARLFQGLDYVEIEGFLQSIGTKESKLEKGEFLWLDDIMHKHLLIVAEGKLNIVRENRETNSDGIIEHMEAGDMFGASFAVLEIPFQGYAVATVATTAFLLPIHPILHGYLYQHPAHGRVSSNFITILATKIQENTRRHHLVRHRSLKRIMAAFFLEQVHPNEAPTFTLSVSKSTLAERLGVSRSAMVRQLTAMQEDGLISYQRNCYTIINRQGLIDIMS